jgi:hypothetical protein
MNNEKMNWVGYHEEHQYVLFDPEEQNNLSPRLVRLFISKINQTVTLNRQMARAQVKTVKDPEITKKINSQYRNSCFLDTKNNKTMDSLNKSELVSENNISIRNRAEKIQSDAKYHQKIKNPYLNPEEYYGFMTSYDYDNLPD